MSSNLIRYSDVEWPVACELGGAKRGKPGKAFRPLRVLHIIVELSETSFPYTELCAPVSDIHELSICTFYKPTVSVSSRIAVYEGDGSVGGFFRAMGRAFLEGPYDILHAHAPHVAFLLMALGLQQGWGIGPWVYTAHHSFTTRNIKLKHKLMMLPVFALFRKVVCVSVASRDSFPRAYQWLARGRLEVVRNGVNLARVDRTVGRLTRFSATDFAVVSVGRLISVKNPICVLEAFRLGADPPSRLVFVGEGELEAALRVRGDVLEDGRRIEFTGLVLRERVYEVLARADLFVSASWGEGLPVAVLEAMACRCPVILSDIPAHREIAGGVDFIPVIPPGDVAGFAQEIARYRQMPLQERLEIGNYCRALVETRFNLADTHQRYEEVYKELLTGSLRNPRRGEHGNRQGRE